MLLRMLDILSPALRDSFCHGDGQQPLPSRRELEGRLRPRLRKMPRSEGQESSPADDSLTKPHLDLRVVLPCNLHISAHGTRNLHFAMPCASLGQLVSWQWQSIQQKLQSACPVI